MAGLLFTSVTFYFALSYSYPLSTSIGHDGPTNSSIDADSLSALQRAREAASTLQQWYHPDSGLWESGWWPSANCLTTLADLASIDPNSTSLASQVAEITYNKAPQQHFQMTKVLLGDYRPHSRFTRIIKNESIIRDGASQPPNHTKGFLNDFYDDEAWWALGWIRAYDFTKKEEYLQVAATIFEDMKAGWTTPCGGGIWWSKEKTYVNAIANELFLSVAAHLANRMPNKDYYLQWALREWDWFSNTGMINEQSTINDGLDNKTCKNNNAEVWSYNQGVVLGGLVDLNRATGGSRPYISYAKSIASAAIKALSRDGILHDPCEPRDRCKGDGEQFKGIFMRNLRELHVYSPEREYRDFIVKNADSIWKNNRKDGKLGAVWSGPFSDPASASTHSSALDALVAAAALE